MHQPTRLQRLVPLLRRCLLTAATLAGYLCATVGFPLPQRIIKDSSQPFPCQDHACGCQTAEQCLAQCCCYSAEEKQAWAEAHKAGQTRGGWNTPRQRDRDACCAKKNDCCHQSATPQAAKGGWVLAIQAWSCRGAGFLWLSQNPVPPPPVWDTWSFEWAPAGWLTPLAVVSDNPAFPPLSPPPRL